MELEGQWWKGQLAADIHQALRYKRISFAENSMKTNFTGSKGTLFPCRTRLKPGERVKWAGRRCAYFPHQPIQTARKCVTGIGSNHIIAPPRSVPLCFRCYQCIMCLTYRSSNHVTKELKLPSYKGQSPQLNLRRYFADLIAIVSNRFRLCPAARHLAVYLLDLFMDRYDISIQQLHVVALSCLLLASKFEEKEDSVPKLEQLNSLGCMTNMNLVLTKQNLLHMELLLLETFQWNLCLPTAAHFIDYYLSIAVHESDLHDGWPMVCLEKTKLYMAKYADYFLEVSLQDHAFLNYAPSLVAAACVASSRIILRLSPTWPARLHRLSAYSWDFLVPCIERLLVAHDNDVKEANKQKGQHGSQATQHGLFQATQPPQQVHLQQHIPQYVQAHQTPLQYPQTTPQQNCQQIVSSHASSYPLQTCPPGLQGGVQARGPIQTAAGVSLAVPIEMKPCLSVSYNRSYQLAGRYPCITPCFER